MDPFNSNKGNFQIIIPHLKFTLRKQSTTRTGIILNAMIAQPTFDPLVHNYTITLFTN
jgi:hypothetical protein